MKVRFDNPTFIVYKFISFKAVCLSSLAGRTKCFTAWQHKLRCRNAGQTTDVITAPCSYSTAVNKFISAAILLCIKYVRLTKSLLNQLKSQFDRYLTVRRLKSSSDYISQKTMREADCGCHQPGTGGVGLPCQTGNYFYCFFYLNNRVVNSSWFGTKWR